MSLQEMQSRLNGDLTTLSAQEKFEYLDVFFNCLADMKTSVFPIQVMIEFAKELGNPDFHGQPVLTHLFNVV